MSENKETLRQGIDNWLANKNIRAGDVAAFDKVRTIASACDVAIASGRLDEAQQALLMESAASASNIVRGNTTELIGGMQERGLNVDALVLALFHSKKAKARLSALSVLKYGRTSAGVHDDILVTALSGKDEGIAFEAATLATIYSRKKWLLPLMQAKAGESLGMARLHQLLDRGYVRNRLPDGTWRFEVLMLAGGVRYADIDEAEMQARGIDAIVTALRDKDPPAVPTVAEMVRGSSSSL